MRESLLSELKERLFVHYAQGGWRAPLTDSVMAVCSADGRPLGTAVRAQSPDIDRALHGLVPGAFAPTALPAFLTDLRRIEGFDDALAPLPAIDLPPGAGPLVMLSAADTPLAQLAGVLAAGASRGLVWKPASGAAVSAHALIAALAPGRGVALLHGDHATGAALAGRGALIWASGAPVPEGMTAALSLGARAPRHR